MKVVAVSGYFNPLHEGHLDYLEAAKELGDCLLVIVNTDKQVKIKGSKAYLNQAARLRLIRALRCVDYALLAADEDGTVCKTLSLLKPAIFANGGDRNKTNCPETAVCKENKIKQIFNVGGKKVNSSSKILKEMTNENN